jgi:2-keto-4-pentenoate hydratase
MSLTEIAKRFVTARKSATALPGYPGDIPSKLEDSYAIQEEAIRLWGKPIVGWKIGRLAPDKQPLFNTERLAGPVFAPMLKAYEGTPEEIPVFEGGFAAVEAEYVFRIGVDTDPAKTEYTEADALGIIDAVFAGIEMAGSPLATINALGPTVVASDFGNNFGLILSDQLLGFDGKSKVEDLGEATTQSLKATTVIDGVTVGEGGLFTMPGGPLKAIAWLAGHVASRGHPLTKGQYITSGATTGIHDIAAGSDAVVTYSSPLHTDVVIKLKTYRLDSSDRVLV